MAYGSEQDFLNWKIYFISFNGDLESGEREKGMTHRLRQALTASSPLYLTQGHTSLFLSVGHKFLETEL